MTDPIVAIVSISEQPAYRVKQMGLMREDYQEFWVDVGGYASKEQISNLLIGNSLLPQPFQAYTLGNFMFAKDIDFDQMKDIPNVWVYKVQWITISNPTEAIADPSKRPVLISMGNYKQQRAPSIDLDGLPVATTAGEPINFQYQQTLATYTFEKNLTDWPSQFGRYRDFVNSDIVTLLGNVYKPFTLFCPEINVSHLQYEGKYKYYTFSATWYVNEEIDANNNIIGWRNLLRNIGYHERVLEGYQKNKRGQFLKSKPIYSFRPITMGPLGSTKFPASPVLINPQGQAFRSKLPTDPAAGPFTGEVIGLAISDTVATTTGITKKQWDAAVVECRFYNLIPFSSSFPLT